MEEKKEALMGFEERERVCVCRHYRVCVWKRGVEAWRGFEEREREREREMNC